MTERQRIAGRSPYEDRFSFSRAVRVGERVLVSGTAPVWPDGGCDPDPGAQTERCFELIAEALAEAGCGLDAVIRTRMFIVDPADADAVGAAHSRAMADARPAASMIVVTGLLDPRWKVEIEAEAVAGD